MCYISNGEALRKGYSSASSHLCHSFVQCRNEHEGELRPKSPLEKKSIPGLSQSTPFQEVTNCSSLKLSSPTHPPLAVTSVLSTSSGIEKGGGVQLQL